MALLLLENEALPENVNLSIEYLINGLSDFEFFLIEKSNWFLTFVVTIESGGKIPVHKHGSADVTIYVLEGRGAFLVGEERRILEPETALYVPVGVGIGLENIGKKTLRFVVAIAPPIDLETCPVCGIKIKNP